MGNGRWGKPIKESGGYQGWPDEAKEAEDRSSALTRPCNTPGHLPRGAGEEENTLVHQTLCKALVPGLPRARPWASTQPLRSVLALPSPFFLLTLTATPFIHILSEHRLFWAGGKVANLLHKGPNILKCKYFRLWGLHGLCHNYPTLSL